MYPKQPEVFGAAFGPIFDRGVAGDTVVFEEVTGHSAAVRLRSGKQVGPPVVPVLTLCLGEGSPTKIDHRKKGALILASLVDLETSSTYRSICPVFF